jgi:hypothetical protein
MEAKDIPPPLSARTLKHRRNVMTTAGIILVVAWVPMWDLQSFAPLGFKIEATGALVIWGVMISILVYFARCLILGVQAELPSWQQHFAAHLNKYNEGDMTPVPFAVARMNRRAVWTDKFLPLFITAFGLLVALSEAAQLTWRSS